ncbi:MAG: hypothetical protein ACP5MG_09095 [Verrucomicrobiia bacterium]
MKITNICSNNKNLTLWFPADAVTRQAGYRITFGMTAGSVRFPVEFGKKDALISV